MSYEHCEKHDCDATNGCEQYNSEEQEAFMRERFGSCGASELLSLEEFKTLLRTRALLPSETINHMVATVNAWAPKHCSCDDIGEGACLVHARENELQNRTIVAEEERKQWEWKYIRLAEEACKNCGDKDPHRLRGT